MDHSDIIRITMLGGCSLSCGEKLIDKKTVHSKRIWALLEYFLTYRTRPVTQNELIELLYPEEKSDAPLSALKTLVYRTRETLSQLCGIDGKQIILQCPGGYQWNPDVIVDADVEKFENAVSEASALDSDQNTQLQLRLKAIALYRGEFLPDSALETWVVPISAYYRYLYLNTLNLTFEKLAERGGFSEIIPLAKNAVAIYPYEENLHYYLILALADSGQIAAARLQYESMTKLFYDEFGVTPSANLQALYKKLSTSGNGVERDLSVIKSQMSRAERAAGAFYCEYEFFKDIYELEVRSSSRKGEPIHIGLLSLGGKEEKQLSKRALNNAMGRLSDSIKKSLRSGDIYSRYSVSQYVILLPRANYENSKKVLDRIIRKFRQDNVHSPASVSFSLEAIDSER